MAIPNTLITTLAMVNEWQTHNLVFGNLFALFAAMGMFFVGIAFIGIVFNILYKSVYVNTVHRDNMPKIGTSGFLSSLHSLFDEPAGLDGFAAYNGYDFEKYSIFADLLIPLIRIKANIALFNKLSIHEIKTSYNLFPNAFHRGSLSKELLADMNAKYFPKADSKPVKAVKNHLEDDIEL